MLQCSQNRHVNENNNYGLPESINEMIVHSYLKDNDIHNKSSFKKIRLLLVDFFVKSKSHFICFTINYTFYRIKVK